MGCLKAGVVANVVVPAPDYVRFANTVFGPPPAAMLTLAPLRLRLGDQSAEVPGRPGIARRPRLRQQPLRRDPARRRLDPLGDQIHDPLEVARPVRFNDPAHRLVWCRRCPPPPDSCPRLDRRQSHPSVPSRSSMEVPFRGSSDWLDTVTVSRGRASTTTTRRTKSGDFHWPPMGTFSWPRTRDEIQNVRAGSSKSHDRDLVLCPLVGDVVVSSDPQGRHLPTQEATSAAFPSLPLTARTVQT